MDIIILIAIYIVELLKYWVLISGILNVKFKRKWLAAVGLIIYIMLSINEKTREQDSHLNMYLIVLVVILISMELKVMQRVINLLIAILVTTCTDEVLELPLIYFSDINIGSTLAADLYMLINSLLSFLTIILIVFLKYKVKSLKKDKLLEALRNIMPFFVLLLFVALVFTIGSLDFAKDYVLNKKFIIFTNGIIAISFFSIGLLLLFTFYISYTNKKMEDMLESERKLKEMQLDYYRDVLKREENTRKYRHDMNNHLICLNQLAKDEASNTVIEYLNIMQNQIIEIQKKVYKVGNEILDAILNYHLSTLQQDVRVGVIGYCNNDILINNVDLCTIFANLIQNAIEELKKDSSGEKHLKIIIKSGKEFIQIEILNSLSDKSLEKTDLLKTEKKDKQNHGLGLGNVKQTIERNGGKFETKVTNREFIANVILKNKMDK